jgi:putative hemolysin
MKAVVLSNLGLLLGAGIMFPVLAQTDGAPAQEPVGMPNPAAVFCVEQAGQYLLESGQCLLPDGTTVDAWDYFRSQSGSQETDQE